MAHPDNHFYGHNVALARASGVDGVPTIVGHVQHGWSPYTGLAEPHRLVRRLRKLVWSSDNLRQATEAGIEDLVPIGAPFLYLPDRAPPPDRDPSSTIVYPYHSIERAQFFAQHERYVDQLRERADGPVTVCLYWRDHEAAEVRRSYEEAGFRVVCHGRREDPGFLNRQQRELLRHGTVATNRLGTALWYGMSSGLRGEVFGTVFGQWDADEGSRYDAMQRRRHPELFKGDLTTAEGAAVAAAELGSEHLRSPAELREILGFDRLGGRAAELACRVRTRAEHHARTAGHHLSRRIRVG